MSGTVKRARGKARYEQVLDACASLLRENQHTRFSMQQLAAKAQASNGSIYHLFPEKSAVLAELWSRHTLACSQIFQEMLSIDDEDWRDWSSDDVIDNMILPTLRYLADNEDLLVLWNHHGEADCGAEDLSQMVRELYGKVLSIRIPKASVVERLQMLEMLMLIPLGVLRPPSQQRRIPMATLLLGECVHSFRAYLAYTEARFR